MIDPAHLKCNPDRSYAFKSSWKTLAAQTLDSVGNFLVGGTSPAIDWRQVQRIAVLRLDHLGDLILALPALKALEEALPEAGVDLFVGPWAVEAAFIAELRANLRVFEASWLSRGKKGGSIGDLEKLLAEGKYDAALELRGDFRHILALHGAGIRRRAGLARTGFGFLLNHWLDYRPGLHETDRNLDLLEQAGVPLRGKASQPKLYPRPEDELAAKTLRQTLGIQHPTIALHVLSPVLSKRWPVENWKKMIEGLPEGFDPVLVGTEGEKTALEEIQKGCARKVFLATGSLTLPGLAAFLKDSALFIGVDSGPAHVAAAVGAKVLSLYSGTNRVSQWAPRGPQVTVLQKTPVCSPCELTVCPIGHECMKGITVEEVLEKAKALLASSV